jgi:hypothetical protein
MNTAAVYSHDYCDVHHLSSHESLRVVEPDVQTWKPSSVCKADLHRAIGMKLKPLQPLVTGITIIN